MVALGVGFRTEWESPVPKPVDGVDLVRGWDYQQTPSASPRTIRFTIDGVENELIVYRSFHPDVAAAFPSM